ncbi:MAG: hypothetical protein K2W96_07425 [Gemmataceae bacterium]|nr:hypothetical protein [Gemmataceae bacterium]
MKRIERDGLSFPVPEDWKFDDERAADGWTLTLQSAGTAFAVVRLDRNLPDPEEMIEAAMEALRAEYRDLEEEPALETIAGDMAHGTDLEFLSLDVPTTCWLRGFHGPAGTVLVMCQVSDLDRVENEPALRAITSGMRTEE